MWYVFAHDSDFELFYKFLKVSLFQEIDEATSWWSQHNAKKLIDTSEKGGLRGSIPIDFPYFYVSFGLDMGYVHIIN
jgi:hypothetical protein